MANIVLEQRPLFKTFPAAQELIFTVSETAIVTTKTRVKFIANVYISKDRGTIGNAANKVATLKTTPNNAGVGMFDLRSIIEAYVSGEYLANGEDSGASVGVVNSQFKGVDFSADKQFPVHLVDKYSLANNTCTFCRVKFQIEYLDGNAVVVDSDSRTSSTFFVFNGYAGNQDTYRAGTIVGMWGLPLGNLGTAMDFSIIQRNDDSSFLTEAPAEQYARIDDYGTVAMFNRLDTSSYSFATAPSGISNAIGSVQIKLYDNTGSQLGSTFTVTNNVTNGGAQLSAYGEIAKSHFMFFGAYPANLTGAGNSNWTTHKANVSYYTIQALDSLSNPITQIYTINILDCNSFGYEGITWLNKFGAWDYYTFDKKSVRTINTKKTQYTQLGGTWNEALYTPQGYKGGMKNFRVNAKEKIKLNTSYLRADNESIFIESLLKSPEVYIINQYSTDWQESSATKSGIINKYIEPVIVTTSNITRKTRANDKLMRYTIEVERNKDNNTQNI